MNTATTLGWIAGALMLLSAIASVVSYANSKKRIWLVTASICFLAAVIQCVSAVIRMRQ